jgi:predicted oxidoreductase
VTGAHGDVLAPSAAARGEQTSRDVVGSFEILAAATIVSSGGIGGNHDLVRAQWPARLGTPPTRMITGVPAYVDGSMQPVARAAGAHLINGDRMWHYVEGIQNWSPIWPNHGIRILPGPSSVWLEATGARLPVPLYPGFDTLGTLAHLRRTGHDHSWFVLSQKIIEKEFTLSGSEQNPDLTGKDVRLLLRSRLGKGAAGPVKAFMDRGADFVVRRSLDELIEGMRALPAARCSIRSSCAARSRRATARSPTTSRRMRRSRCSDPHARSAATASSAPRHLTGSSTRRTDR